MANLIKALDSSDTTIIMTSFPGGSEAVLVIDRIDSYGNLTPSLMEYVRMDFDGNISRGFLGSSPKAHTNGALVEEALPGFITRKLEERELTLVDYLKGALIL